MAAFVSLQRLGRKNMCRMHRPRAPESPSTRTPEHAGGVGVELALPACKKVGKPSPCIARGCRLSVDLNPELADTAGRW